MSKIIIKVNNVDKVKAECAEACKKALTICGANWVEHAADLTPVDTGRLRERLEHQMDGDTTVQVGTNVEYAAYVEYGDNMAHTVGQAHYLRDSGMNNVDEYKNILEQELKSG